MPAGQGRGRGRGMGGGGQGLGMGPVKQCRCPNCEYIQPHQPGRPCVGQICPECGANMMGM